MEAQREMRPSALPAMMGRAAVRVLNLLFPPLCVSCRARVGEAHSLCAKCWSAISFIEGAMCSRCGSPFDVDPGSETVCGACHMKPHDFTHARSLFRYDDASNPSFSLSSTATGWTMLRPSPVGWNAPDGRCLPTSM